MKYLILLLLLLMPLSLVAQAAEPEVPSQVLSFLHNNPAGQKISASKLLKRMADPDKIVFIDVRTPQEFAVMHISGAINIPYDQLAEHLDQIPHDGLVVAYCHSGRRAEGATAVLHILGYDNVVNLSGGIKALTPAITSKSSPAVKSKGDIETPVDATPAEDDDSDEEDMGC